MKDFLEKTLRQSVTIKENNSLYEKLPLAIKGRYIIFDVETNGIQWTAIQPKMDSGLIYIRKDRARVQSVSGLNCAVFLNSTSCYIKDKLIEEGIKEKKKIRRGEEPGCVVLELGYFIDFRKKPMEDPLSVVLSLTDEEKQDERVMISINEMLEEYVW